MQSKPRPQTQEKTPTQARKQGNIDPKDQQRPKKDETPKVAVSDLQRTAIELQNERAHVEDKPASTFSAVK